MTVLWVDVSKHDWNRRGGALDWSKILPATSRCMCARLTYGDPQGYNPSSPHGVEMVQAAKTAGADLRGGYHNLIRGDQASINRQVDYLRREADRASANWGMCDVERYPELVSNGLWPRWDDVRQFHDRWYAVEQRVMAWYIPPWLWSGYLGKPDLRVLKGPLIASRYPLGDTADDPWDLYRRCGGDTGSGWTSYGNRDPDGWQYSSRAVVPGASPATDINARRGTYAQWQTALLGQATQPPEDDMDAEQDRKLDNLDKVLSAWLTDQDVAKGLRLPDGKVIEQPIGPSVRLRRVEAKLAELAAVPPGSVVLGADQLEQIAVRVADLLADRLKD